jgi:SAM-dependent methyltransferase
VTTSPAWRSVEELYGYGAAFAEYEAFDAELDVSLNPSGFDLLYEIVEGLALEDGALAVDVGCREAWHSIELARRFGLTVHGIDPVTRHIDGARRALADLAAAEPGVADRVQVALGRAESLTEPDGSVSLIWCRDVLVHVEDLRAALGEFRRVLRPDGHAVVYQMMATDWLQPDEAERLWPPAGVFASNVDPGYFDAAIGSAGLKIAQCIDLQGSWREYAEEDGAGISSRQLLHASRLLRNWPQYEARFGADACNAMLTNCLWGVYQMIGKLSPRVYLLSC